MRTILAIAVLLALATVPAAARSWPDTSNPLALPHQTLPATDADLERRERAKRSYEDVDDFTRHLGLDHGRAEIMHYQLDGEPDSGVRAWLDGGGATLEVRW